jgi:hypothetical protein
MGQVEFGKLVSQRMSELGISQRRLGSRLGELSDGSNFDSSAIRAVKDGLRRLTHELVSRLIEELKMTPEQADEAWAASGLLPPGVTAEELRQLRSFRRAPVAAQPEKLTGWKPVPAGQPAPAPAPRVPLPSDLGALREFDELVRRNGRGRRRLRSLTAVTAVTPAA